MLINPDNLFNITINTEQFQANFAKYCLFLHYLRQRPSLTFSITIQFFSLTASLFPFRKASSRSPDLTRPVSLELRPPSDLTWSIYRPSRPSTSRFFAFE